MDFRTIVPLPPEAPVVTPSTRALVLGSCFAEHIGERLRVALGAEQCCVNPFGVLYNPMSIAQALELLLAAPSSHADGRTPQLDDAIFEGRDGLWHSWLHSTHYSAATREECSARCHAAMAEARRVLDEADLLIVTFGTSRCYTLTDEPPPHAPTAAPHATADAGGATSRVVANCHKELATRFAEHDCTTHDIVATWRPLLDELQRRRPGLQVVFTVSPYRYRKYGYHASQLAKARLLLAVDDLPAHYFPAYEIVLDELRDYRYYKPDMLHPSDQAVDYIWERFAEWALTPDAAAQYIQHTRALKQLRHHENH